MTGACLTREQRAAVACPTHALAIHAGAGTGKTLTLAHRVARMASAPQDQARCVVVTFTREATASLQRKLSLLLGRSHLVRILSFHQWAARELPPGDRRFLEDGKQRDLMSVLLRRTRIRLDASEDAVARATAFLGYVKNRETTVADAVRDAYPAWAAQADALEALREAYEEAKGDRLDYDDVLLAFRDRLRKDTFRRKVAERIDHLFVDEYQDVNGVQADAVRLLTVKRGAPRVTVVGDPRQSIYGFRGGAPAHLEGFLAPYGARGRLVALTTNFRATRHLVDAANRVEPGLHPMTSAQDAPAGVAPHVDRHPDGAREALAALARVEALLAEGVDPCEIAVLCRARRLAEAFQDAQARRLRDEGAPGRLDEVAVRTIHAAKGLEWDHVLLLGAREGGLPGDHALRTGRAELMAEERRLAYVAITRARRTFVAYAGGAASRFYAALEEKKWEEGPPAFRRAAAGRA